MPNPLLQNFNTPFSTAPFSKIKNKHFKPAIEKGIALAKAEIDALVASKETPNFQNTIEALEFSGEKLDRITSIFFNLNSAETNKEIQKIAQEVSPLLAEFGNDITLNEALFSKIKQVYTKKEKLNLNTEQTSLLEKRYKSFSRNGANLNEQDKTILRKVDKELATLKLQFSENILAETQAYELHLTKKEELDGLPKAAIEAASQIAKQKEKEGWVFTLDFPSYYAIMTYSEHRHLREQMNKAYGKRSFQNNEQNNELNVLKIAKLRYQRARLLGYETHAHFVLEERMAETPEKVQSFLQDLLDKALPAAKREFTELQEFAKKDGVSDLQLWDASYYSEKLKKQRFNLDDELLKPYFQTDKVLKGAFKIAANLYDLHFELLQTVDTYHKDVQVYKVTDNEGNFIAIFYADFFPREGKRNGAWMTSYKGQWKKGDKNSRPHISIVCNFTKPTKTTPSLLTFREVTTLLHEFGHALHGMLANTTYPSLSGTSVYWDFVELPSQLLENWGYEQEALALFATHYQTDELIPQEYVQKIKESANFMEGMASIRQLSFGLLDLAWHGTNPTEISDVKAYEKKAFESTQLYPDVITSCQSTAFSHIFPGGYSSGYYSYKWAEVLDADAFEFFQEKGIFNKEVAQLFKDNILSKGGTDKPMTLYKKFRGKEPSVDALLKRAGLN
ncbi:MAG TPA: M3 family peptidase [Lutibacter sp.]|nr:M3 family peptidase [Lutibacter sp.]